MRKEIKKYYDHYINKLIEKTGSREDAEEIFGEMSFTVLITSVNKMMLQVKDSKKQKEIFEQFKLENFDSVFDMFYDLGIDPEKVIHESFVEIFAGVVSV